MLHYSSSTFRVLQLIGGFLFFFSQQVLQAQSIKYISPSESTFCAGKSAEVTFEVTNGNNKANYFTSTTSYTISLGRNLDGNAEVSSAEQKTFKTGIAPVPGDQETQLISYSFEVPAETAPGDDYQFLITSNSPAVPGSKEALSSTFTILEKVERPVISSNFPVSEGDVLQLSASTVPGATYSWGGPNDFTSNEQNPKIENVSLSDSGEYFVSATLNGCESDLRFYTVTVNSHISNNYLSSSFGTTGTVCATSPEFEVLSISAPPATVFTEVRFASYGLPEGTCGNFRLGTCNSNTSRAVVEEYLIGNDAASIPAENDVFGDPCIATFKRLYIEATYSEFVCSGSDAGILTGTTPKGGNGEYHYLWESSITGPNGIFSPAPGENRSRDYEPGILEKTTWYRRTVTSGNYSNESAVLLLQVEENKWSGAISKDWHNPSNWTCQQVPSGDSKVIIPGGLVNYPRLYPGEIGEAGDLEISSGAYLEIENNELHISGSIKNKGYIHAVIGTVAFVGSSKQEIPGGTFLNNRIRNLIINNAEGVNSQGPLKISGYLRAEKGDLHTGNQLTLLSEENQAALIDGTGKGEVLGTVHMQRYLDSAFGYHYFASPFRNSVVGDFSPYIDLNAAPPQFYQYTGTGKATAANGPGWQVYTGPTSPLFPLEGYSLYLGNSSASRTVEISGIVNNGTLEKVFINPGSENRSGFHLAGNPYPSPIDWDSPGWTKKNVDPAIYFFEAGGDNPYSGTYNAIINGIHSHEGKSSTIIPAMQGFFVHVSSSAGSSEKGILRVTNEVRVNDPSLREGDKPSTSEFPLMRLTANFENESSKDPTVIYFVTDGTTSFEREKDAVKMRNTTIDVPDFYSITPENENLTINAAPFPDNSRTDSIPLGIAVRKEGNMVFELTHIENISQDINIALVDKEARIVQDLRKTPKYLFNAQKGEVNDRFYLVYTRSVLFDFPEVSEPPFTALTSENWNVMVKMNLKTGQAGRLRVSSVSGKILEVLDVTEKQTVEIKGIRSTGVYFITLISADNKYTRQILVQK